MKKNLTRRQFIAVAAAGTGGAALMCSGLGMMAFRPPATGYYRQLATQRDPSQPAVLVAYGSKAGSTVGVAQAIAEQLKQRDFAVDISPVSRVSELGGYRFAVIGSAIRMGAPLAEVTDFVNQHSDTLNAIPTAFFAVYLMNAQDNEAGQKARAAYINSIRAKVGLQHEAFFTGAFIPKNVSFMEGLMGKMMKSPVGDFRDWNAISKWGQEIFESA